jgi:hypothetical protein
LKNYGAVDAEAIAPTRLKPMTACACDRGNTASRRALPVLEMNPARYTI